MGGWVQSLAYDEWWHRYGLHKFIWLSLSRVRVRALSLVLCMAQIPNFRPTNIAYIVSGKHNDDNDDDIDNDDDDYAVMMGALFAAYNSE